MVALALTICKWAPLRNPEEPSPVLRHQAESDLGSPRKPEPADRAGVEIVEFGSPEHRGEAIDAVVEDRPGVIVVVLEQHRGARAPPADGDIAPARLAGVGSY